MRQPASQILNRIREEADKRLVRQQKIRVIDYKPSSVLPETQLAPTGSITMFMARRGNPLMNEIQSAAEDPKGGRDRRIMKQLLRQIASRKAVRLEEAAKVAMNAPVLGELRYGGSTVRTHMFLPDPDAIAVSVMPYAGGPLAAEGFTFLEFYDEADKEEGLELVLVKNDPILSAAELAATKIVPPDLVHVFVHPGLIHENTVLWVLLFVAAEVVVEWATFTLVKGHDDKSMEHINPAAIESLGPLGTARALVNMRAEMLKGKAQAIIEEEAIAQ